MKMERKSKKTKTSKDARTEKYLKIPYHILNIDTLDLREKVLLAHIYSYGLKGCWEGNKRLGMLFRVSERSISRWIARLKKSGFIFWVHPKGRYRTIWAKSHSDVKTAQYLYYIDEKISKEAVVKGHAARILQRQDCQGPIDNSVVPTSPECVFQVRQNCLHTNNTTIKDTTAKTIASPAPLPAGGQAPAALEDRKREADSKIERFGKNFGKARTSPKLSAEEDEKRRQYLQKQLAEADK
jgi:hypothetical protein